MTTTHTVSLTALEVDAARAAHAAGMYGLNATLRDVYMSIARRKSVKIVERGCPLPTSQWGKLYIAAISAARRERGLPDVPQEHTEAYRDFETDSFVVKTQVRWTMLNDPRAFYGSYGL